VQELIKQDDGTFLLKQEFHVKLTKEECVKNKTFLQNNIQTLEKMKDDLTIEKIKEKMLHEVKRLEVQKKGLSDALQNLDKHIHKQVLDLKKNKHETRKKMMTDLERFDENTTAHLERMKKQLQDQLANVLWQYEDDTKKIQIYDQVVLE